MKRLRLSPLVFRRIHRWVGLIVGIQFLLWTLSGSMMALLDMDTVGGHANEEAHVHPLSEGEYASPAAVTRDEAVTGLVLRDLGGRPVYEIHRAKGVDLFDATTGERITVDKGLARDVATMMHDAPVRNVSLLAEPNLEARDHAGAMWRIDFADAENSSAYIAQDTGRFLVIRGDAWRMWDFFWMLHNMDYVNRTSFNHPLIVFFGFGALWMAGTGFYLLFRSFSAADFRWLRRRRKHRQGRVSV